jgi:glycosyltransferase involved in cell wall biosynthesis
MSELVLPNGLETIGDNAFGWCDIECLNIPKSVKKIGSMAFSDVDVIALEADYVISTGEYPFYSFDTPIYFNSIAYRYDRNTYILHNDNTATVVDIDNFDNEQLNLLGKITYNNGVYTVNTIGTDACRYTTLEKIIIPNTINVKKIKKLYEPKQFRYIYIGRYAVKTKGLDLLIETFINLKEWCNKNNVLLELYGPLDDNVELEILKHKIRCVVRGQERDVCPVGYKEWNPLGFTLLKYETEKVEITTGNIPDQKSVALVVGFEKGNCDSCEIKVNGKIIKDFKPYSIPDHKNLMPESIKTFCANVETKAQQKQIVEATGIKDETKFKWMELVIE